LGKWKLFSNHANTNNGKFFLVVPVTMKPKVKNDMDEHDIQGSVLGFKDKK